MNTQNSSIINYIFDTIVRNGIDWIITAVITFISVRLATKKYYSSIRSNIVKPHMEKGLKLVLGSEIIPANAKSILVKNKGFTAFRGRKYKGNRCFSLLRKTVATVGGNDNSTSRARALYWGVLGLAYKMEKILVYDFNEHKLLCYNTDLVNKNVQKKTDGYYFIGTIEGGKENEHKLSELDSGRNVIYAIPLVDKVTRKLVGGITFDVDCAINEKAEDGKKKVYSNDTTEVIEICRQLDDICSNLITAYFSER